MSPRTSWSGYIPPWAQASQITTWCHTIEKIWKYPLELMNTEWIAGRVPAPSVEEMRKGAEAPQPIDYGPNAEFWYPKHGGIGALAESLAENLPVKLGAEANVVQPNQQQE